MGINNFYSFLKTAAPKVAGAAVSVESLAGSVLAVDANNMLWKMKYARRPLADVTSAMLRNMSKHRMRPVFVFDGASAKAPAVVTTRCHARAKATGRAKERQKTIETELAVVQEELRAVVAASPTKTSPSRTPSPPKTPPSSSPTRSPKRAASPPPAAAEPSAENLVAREAGLRESLGRAMSQQTRVTGADVREFMALLRGHGVAVVQAPGEGEGMCAMLARLGYADAVVSEDSDCLMYGAPVLIRGFGPSSGWWATDTVTVYRLQPILEALGMEQEQFQMMGVLAKSDFTGGKVRGIGIKTAHTRLKKHKTIEGVLANIAGGAVLTGDFNHAYAMAEFASCSAGSALPEAVARQLGGLATRRRTPSSPAAAAAKLIASSSSPSSSWGPSSSWVPSSYACASQSPSRAF